MSETRTCSKYPRRLLGSLRQMRSDELLTDLTIMIGDDEVVYNVHKCVMVAASNHFAALVHAEQLNDSHCLIKGVEEDHWATLLDFIYSGELNLTADNCLPLHSTAQQLGINEAERLCDEYIKDNNFDISDEELEDIESIKQEKEEEEESTGEDDSNFRLPSPVPIEPETSPVLKEEPEEPKPITASVKRSLRTRRKPRHLREGEEDPEWVVETPKRDRKSDLASEEVGDEDKDPDWDVEEILNRKRKTEEVLTEEDGVLASSEEDIKLESVSARKKRRLTDQSKTPPSTSKEMKSDQEKVKKIDKFLDFVIKMEPKRNLAKKNAVEKSFRKKKKVPTATLR